MANPASLLRDIENALRPRIEAKGGNLDMASDLGHALEMLSTKVRGWRVIINFEGYGDHELADDGMNTCRFQIFLHANKGLATPVGNAIHRDQNGTDSFLSRIEFVSQLLRALRWPNGHNVACKGMAVADSQWIIDAPDHTRAHVLNASLVIALEQNIEVIDISNPNQ